MVNHRAIMGSADGRDSEEEKPSFFPDRIIIDWVYRMQRYFIQTTSTMYSFNIYIIFLVKYYILDVKLTFFKLFFSSFVNKIKTSDRII